MTSLTCHVRYFIGMLISDEEKSELRILYGTHCSYEPFSSLYLDSLVWSGGFLFSSVIRQGSNSISG